MWRCPPCDKLISKKDMLAHFSGKVHLERAGDAWWFCSLCERLMQTGTKAAHVSGKMHREEECGEKRRTSCEQPAAARTSSEPAARAANVVPPSSNARATETDRAEAEQRKSIPDNSTQRTSGEVPSAADRRFARKIARFVREYNAWSCSICKESESGEGNEDERRSFTHHLLTKKHLVYAADSVKENKFSNPPSWTCYVCNKLMRADAKTAHLNGKPHRESLCAAYGLLLENVQAWKSPEVVLPEFEFRPSVRPSADLRLLGWDGEPIEEQDDLFAESNRIFAAQEAAEKEKQKRGKRRAYAKEQPFWCCSLCNCNLFLTSFDLEQQGADIQNSIDEHLDLDVGHRDLLANETLNFEQIEKAKQAELVERVLGERQGSPGVVLVEDVKTCQDVVAKLLSEREVALDIEGVNLGREGTISVIQICGEQSPVYIFDIHKATNLFTDGGLQKLLETTRTQKVVFDGRRDADALYHLYGIELRAVFDLQVCYVLWKSNDNLTNAKGGTPKGKGKGMMFLPGLGACLDEYLSKYGTALELETAKTIKALGKSLFAPEKGGSYQAWEERPMGKQLIAYAASDVRYLLGMRQRWGDLSRLAARVLQISEPRIANVVHADTLNENRDAMRKVDFSYRIK